MIKDKKDALDKQLYQINKNSRKKGLIALFAAVAFGSFGLATTVLMSMVGIPALLTSLGLGITARNVGKRKKQIESRIIQEKNHLKKVEEKGLDISKDVSNKRINKLIELRNSKDSKEKKKKILTILNSLGIVGLMASSIVAVALAPTAGMIGGILSAIVKLSTDPLIVKKNSEIETLRNRINNLNNDLDIIRNRVKTVPFRNSDIKTADKQEEQPTARTKKVSSSSKENDAIVQEYVDKLTTTEQAEKPVQKVKQ